MTINLFENYIDIGLAIKVLYEVENGQSSWNLGGRGLLNFKIELIGMVLITSPNDSTYLDPIYPKNMWVFFRVYFL